MKRYVHKVYGTGHWHDPVTGKEITGKKRTKCLKLALKALKYACKEQEQK